MQQWMGVRNNGLFNGFLYFFRNNTNTCLFNGRTIIKISNKQTHLVSQFNFDWTNIVRNINFNCMEMSTTVKQYSLSVYDINNAHNNPI